MEGVGLNSKSRYIALIIISISSFITAFSSSSLTIAAPSIQTDLDIDTATSGWILAIYALATAMMQIPFGKLSDIYGRKKFYILGIGIFSLSSLIVGFVSTTPLLLILRFIQGMGGAFMFATGTAILSSVFPSDKKGLAFGFNIGSVYTGLTAGPTLGGLITEQLNWRWLFYITAIIGVIILVIGLFGLGWNKIEQVEEKFDLIGSIIYILALFAFIYGFRILSNQRYLFAGLLIGGSLVTMVLFIYWEIKIDSPILDMSIFQKNRFFNFASLTALTFYTATTATTLFLSFYLQQIKGFSSQTAGLILLARPVVQAMLSPLGGFLSDRVEHRILTTTGVSIGLIGLFLLIFLDTNSTLLLVIFSLILGGIGFGFFSSPNANSIMSSIQKRHYGVASAMIGTMRTIGQSLSLGTATVIFALVIGDVSPQSEQYVPLFLKSSQIGFIILTSICAFSIVFSILRGKNRLIQRK